MVKGSEPIVVAHSGLADKQYAGTRGHPATVTDKTGFWDSGCGWGVLEQGEWGFVWRFI